MPNYRPINNVFILTKNSFSPKCNICTSLTALFNWFWRYKQLKDCKNNKKLKKLVALFSCILKTVFASSDSFCLITSQLRSNYCLLGIKTWCSAGCSWNYYLGVSWLFSFVCIYVGESLDTRFLKMGEYMRDFVCFFRVNCRM